MKTAPNLSSIKRSSKLISTIAVSVTLVSVMLSGVCLDSVHSKGGNVKVRSLTKQAKVSMKQAEKIALTEVPGRVRRIELETDDGVLIYEIVICQGRTKKEVKVNAKSGTIIEIDKKLGKCDKE